VVRCQRAVMTTLPSLVRWSTASGAVRYRLGDPLVDRYLEFVAGRARPNSLRATAFDLKTFFSVVAKDPLEVTPADVFEFLAEQRGDRTVVRISDAESGLSARTIARRLSVTWNLSVRMISSSSLDHGLERCIGQQGGAGGEVAGAGSARAGGGVVAGMD